ERVEEVALALERTPPVLEPLGRSEAVGPLLVREVDPCRVEQTPRRDQAGQGARRVGAAAEADHEDAVARRVVARNEGVAAYDPGDETRPAGAAAHLHEKVAGVTDSVQVLGDLLDRPVRSREAPLLLVGQP